MKEILVPCGPLHDDAGDRTAGASKPTFVPCRRPRRPAFFPAAILLAPALALPACRAFFARPPGRAAVPRPTRRHVNSAPSPAPAPPRWSPLPRAEEDALLESARAWESLRAVRNALALETLPRIPTDLEWALAAGTDTVVLEEAVAAGEAAMDALMASHMGLVRKVVDDRRGDAAADRGDILREGSVGLSRAVVEYNRDNDGSFAAYAENRIRENLRPRRGGDFSLPEGMLGDGLRRVLAATSGRNRAAATALEEDTVTYDEPTTPSAPNVPRASTPPARVDDGARNSNYPVTYDELTTPSAPNVPRASTPPERVDDGAKNSNYPEWEGVVQKSSSSTYFSPKTYDDGNPKPASKKSAPPKNPSQQQRHDRTPPPPAPIRGLSSELIARAGSGTAFSGAALGVGGLDDVLAQIRRRVWIPLAAPPHLLDELGVRPIRGLLLHGPPGCGKTLLARTLGRILSPARPVTVVSGPEVMERFVGASEENVRALFDEPPPLDPAFLTGTPGRDSDLGRAALHIIVLDEFDAIARARGGGGGAQADSGVARDSVVNQLLAKMDGVEELPVPTLVVGLTNSANLIDPALLRPGRFEVQIEVPAPTTALQRESILQVHMARMVQMGRVLVAEACAGSAAERCAQAGDDAAPPPTYASLVTALASAAEGFTGAELASICRSAASRALERAVEDFAGVVAGGDPLRDAGSGATSVEDCLVTEEDLMAAVREVQASSVVRRTTREETGETPDTAAEPGQASSVAKMPDRPEETEENPDTETEPGPAE